VGIIVGTEIIVEENIYVSDWIKMLFFFIFMIIARYLMIMSFWPILKSRILNINIYKFVIIFFIIFCCN
jgi:hypothetical protein